MRDTIDILPANFPRTRALNEAIINDCGRRFGHLIHDLCEGFGLTRMELFLILIDFLQLKVKEME